MLQCKIDILFHRVNTRRNSIAKSEKWKYNNWCSRVKYNLILHAKQSHFLFISFFKLNIISYCRITSCAYIHDVIMFKKNTMLVVDLEEYCSFGEIYLFKLLSVYNVIFSYSSCTWYHESSRVRISITAMIQNIDGALPMSLKMQIRKSAGQIKWIYNTQRQ